MSPRASGVLAPVARTRRGTPLAASPLKATVRLWLPRPSARRLLTGGPQPHPRRGSRVADLQAHLGEKGETFYGIRRRDPGDHERGGPENRDPVAQAYGPDAQGQTANSRPRPDRGRPH